MKLFGVVEGFIILWFITICSFPMFKKSSQIVMELLPKNGTNFPKSSSITSNESSENSKRTKITKITILSNKT